MADRFLKSISGGNEFAIDFFSGELTSTSQTVTIPCPAGKRLNLTWLRQNQFSGNTTITVGARVIVDGLVLTQDFLVGGSGSANTIPNIQGNVGESIVMTLTGSTPSVTYAYSYGT